MRILIVTREVSPFAALTEVAEFTSELQKGLLRLGHDARVALPAYSWVETDARYVVRPVTEGVELDLAGETRRAYLKSILHADSLTYLIGEHQCPNQIDFQPVYPHRWEPHAFFAKAVIAALRTAQPYWLPDVIHAGGLCCALLPAYLRVEHSGEPDMCLIPAVLTLHTPADYDPALQFSTRRRAQFLNAGLAFADEAILASGSAQAASDRRRRLNGRARGLGRPSSLHSLPMSAEAVADYEALYTGALARRNPRALAA